MPIGEALATAMIPIAQQLLTDRGQPYERAAERMEDIGDIAQQYYGPYAQAGQQALEDLQQRFGAMAQSPTDVMGDIMEQYEESPRAQFEQQQLERSLGNTAAAGGFAGTPYHQQQVGDQVQQLLSKDMERYLQDALGIQRTGLAGEQDIMGKGLQAGGQLADVLGTLRGQQAGLGFRGEMAQQTGQESITNALAKALQQRGGVQTGRQMFGEAAQTPTQVGADMLGF